MSENNKTELNVSDLTKDDTLALKGIALLLLLIHHLFYQNAGLYNDVLLWNGHYLIQEIGIMSKACVAIFVFLSGYDLTISTEQNGGIKSLKDFYICRFKKLFLNYWFIWIIFVPVSYFLFDMTFEKTYQHNVSLQLMTDFWGIHNIVFGSTILCYNPTWWFYSCIIILYIFFPLLYKNVDFNVISTILGSIVVSLIPISHLECIQWYIFAFVLGIMFATHKSPPSNLYMPISILVLFMIVRNFTKYPIFTDCLISIAFIQLYRCGIICKPIKRILSFIGKHSMNIFLFHTFIYYFWFKEYIYSYKNPIVILGILLSICLCISTGLEWIKGLLLTKKNYENKNCYYRR